MYAVDLSVPQIACTELKKNSIKHLDYQIFLEFLGYKSCENRLEIYKSLEEYLTVESKYYFSEHPEIIEQLKSYTALDITARYFDEMNMFSDINEIKEELAKVKEAFQITVKYERCPIYLSYEYDELLDICVKGGILSGKELFETVKMFSTIRANERLLDSLEKERIECKYYSARPKTNDKFELDGHSGYYAIGDGAGFTRSLAQAAAQGLMVADTLLEEAVDWKNII